MPLLAFISVLGVAAAAVLVGLLVHSIIEDRRGDIAVLLALGAEAPAVARGLLRHAVVLVSGGTGAGIGLAVGASALLDRFLPTIPLTIWVADAVVAAGVFIAAGAIAGLVPVVQLARIDPLESFRA